MWRAFCLLFFVGWVAGASAEPLYWTLPARAQKSFGANTSSVFIAPYITQVETTLTVTISKSSATGNSGNSGNSGSAAGKSTAPTILYASFLDGQIRYWLSCDLTSVLHPGDEVIVTGNTPADYNTTTGGNATPAIVASVKPGQIIVWNPSAPAAPAGAFKSGGIVNAQKFDNCPVTGDTFNVALTVTPTAVARGYLYLHRNSFFDDSIDFGLGSDGMLSNSDTSSTQEITAILTELAQTAAAVAPLGAPLGDAAVVKPLDADKTKIQQLKKDTPTEAAKLLGGLSDNDFKDLLNKMSPAELGVVLMKLSREDLLKVLQRLVPGAADQPAPEFNSLMEGLESGGTAFEILNSLGPANGELVKRIPALELETINREGLIYEKSKFDAEARAVCYRAVSNLVQTTPFYDWVAFRQITGTTISGHVTGSKAVINPTIARDGSVLRGATIAWTIPINSAAATGDTNSDAVSVEFVLETRINSYNQTIDTKRPVAGFVAFFPVAALARNKCLVDRWIPQLGSGPTKLPRNSFLLSAPSVVNLYTESHLLSPQRDFFTNPHDTFTFTAGLITGHKFTGQSAAKTIVDTITQPIRSLMPSVSVTQSVAVSPTGKTTTTSTQTGAPKGP